MKQSIEAPLDVAQRLYPLVNPERWQNTEALTPCEALLIHYSIQPTPILTKQHFYPQHVSNLNEKELFDYISAHFYGDRLKFVLSLDSQELWDQMQRAFLTHSLILLTENFPPFYNSCIRKDSLDKWLLSLHLKSPLLLATEEEVTSPEITNLKSEITSFNLRSFDRDQLAKMHTRCIAAWIWKENPDIGLQTLIRSKSFTSTTKPFFELIEKKEGYEGETLINWIRDLHPEYPKRKKSRKKKSD